MTDTGMDSKTFKIFQAMLILNISLAKEMLQVGCFAGNRTGLFKAACISSSF